MTKKEKELKRVGYTVSAIAEYALREHLTYAEAVRKLFKYEQSFLSKQETLEPVTLELE